MVSPPAMPTPSVLAVDPHGYPLTHAHAHGLGLAPSLHIDTTGMSSFPESSNGSRRQRIGMACTYCRHRKIRCCGGNPCRNCQRSSRSCSYAPVPEEINRLTREKKALAKATKAATPSPSTTFSPYFADQPVFQLPYSASTSYLHVPSPVHATPGAPGLGRPAYLAHRRCSSTPNAEIAPWVAPPPAPIMNSPPVMESAQWMYNSWNNAPWSTPTQPSVMAPAPATVGPSYPSVLQMPAPFPQNPSMLDAPFQHHQQSSAPASPPDSRATSVESDPTTASSYAPHTPAPVMSMSGYMPSPVSTTGGPYSTPVRPKGHHRRTATMTSSFGGAHSPLESPVSPAMSFFTPYPTPPMQQHQHMAAPTISSASIYSPSPLGGHGHALGTSPTLAPEMKAEQHGHAHGLVGLGIGIGHMVIDEPSYHTPMHESEAYFQEQLQY